MTPIGAAVEIGVLCEMIEGVAGAVEAGSNIMAAIISRPAIRTTGLALLLSLMPNVPRSAATLDRACGLAGARCRITILRKQFEAQRARYRVGLGEA
jgi:hypothetical protein